MTSFEGHEATGEQSGDERGRMLNEVTKTVFKEVDGQTSNQEKGQSGEVVLKINGREYPVEDKSDATVMRALRDHAVAEKILEDIRGRNENSSTDKINFLEEVVASKLENVMNHRLELAKSLAEIDYQYPALARDLEKRFSDLKAVFDLGKESFEDINKKAA